MKSWGWDTFNDQLPLKVNDAIFDLEGISQKRGFAIFRCSPGADGLIPKYNVRRQIHNRITKYNQEHLLIFTDKNNTQQVWQLVVRQDDKPDKVSETQYTKGQEPEALYQKLKNVFFDLAEENKIGIVDVRQRLASEFASNAEKVTKRFYDKF